MSMVNAERRNSIANTLELRHSYVNPSMCSTSMFYNMNYHAIAFHFL